MQQSLKPATKSKREVLGRVQEVRVQSAKALGSLADWLQAIQPPQKFRGQKENRSEIRWDTPGWYLIPKLSG